MIFMAILKGNNQKNTLNGGIGDDVIYGFDGNDILIGDAGNDNLKGGAGADILIGGDGNDFLNGGSGTDILIGGDGDDIYLVDNIADVTTELANAGTDTVRSTISWTLGANLENLVLLGASAVNGKGNALHNTLKGNDADNVLDGGAGNDLLNGGLGADTLMGGAGNDTLRIKDFNGDVIDGGTGTDSLQIVADNQILDLRNAPTIKNIEAIRLADSHSTLIVDAQSIIDLSSDSNTLKVDASGDSNTLKMDSGWTDEGLKNGYHTFTKNGATLQVNPIITDIQTPTTYTISDAATATNVSGVFNSNVQEIIIDFGGKAYGKAGLTTIDLTGFGSEDKLLIAEHDGIVHSPSMPQHPTLSQGKSILESVSFYPNIRNWDQASWQAGASTAQLFSAQRITPLIPSSPNAKTVTITGKVELTGLPTGLAGSQFVFV